MTPAMWHGLAASATLPTEVRVVVLRGEGPSFSAGLDRRLFTPQACPARTRCPARPSPDVEDVDRGLPVGFTWLRGPAIVSVAAVQGHAIGGGLPAGPGLRPAGARRRRAVLHEGAGARAGARPRPAPSRWSRSSGCPARWRLCLTGRTVGADEAAAAGPGRTASCRGRTSTPPSRDLVAALLRCDPRRPRATKALLPRAARQRHWRSRRRPSAGGAGAALQRARLTGCRRWVCSPIADAGKSPASRGRLPACMSQLAGDARVLPGPVGHQAAAGPGTVRRIAVATPGRTAGSGRASWCSTVAGRGGHGGVPAAARPIIDDGILARNTTVVVVVAADRRRARAVRRRADARRSAGSPRGSARASSTTCAPRCSATCSGSRSRSSPGPRPARWSAG